MKDLAIYNDFFKEVIEAINSARYEAYKSINKHHIGLNFEIGKSSKFQIIVHIMDSCPKNELSCPKDG